MKIRDDMELLKYEYKGYTFYFRLLDSSIKTYDKGKHFLFQIPVNEKDNRVEEFVVSFRLEADYIDTAFNKTTEKIEEHIDEMI